jgi:hypothetical protein
MTNRRARTEIPASLFDLSNHAAFVLAACFTALAITASPTNLFAQSGPVAPPATSACPSGSPGFITPLVAAAETPQVPPLERPSMLEAEATMVQIARRIMNDPHLFAFEVSFNGNFLQLGPDKSGYTMWADYESPCDQVQYLTISRWVNLRNYSADFAHLGEGPFLPAYSCTGGAPPPPDPPDAPHVAKPDPEPESKHPPVEGWTLDLPQLWRIAKSHKALFANGLERCTITTAARLKEGDSKPQCGGGMVFDSLAWNGTVPSDRPVKRLVNEHGQRAVIELVEHGLEKPQPGYPFVHCAKGHYLIVDAGSGADLDSGVYFFCLSLPA